VPNLVEIRPRYGKSSIFQDGGDFYVLFDQIGDAEVKNEVKTGTGSSFPRNLSEKPNFRVF